MEAHTLSSRISSVTVYRSGARITRSVALCEEVLKGGLWRVEGLPLAMIDSSISTRIVASKTSSLVATDFRVVLDVPSASGLSEAKPAEIRDLQIAVRQLTARESFLRKELEYQLPLSDRPFPEGQMTPLESPLEARMALLEFSQAQFDSLSEQLRDTKQELEGKQEALQLLEARDRADSSARAVREAEVRKSILVNAHGQGDLSCVLEIDYIVPGACWAPSYSIRFSSDLRQAKLSMRAVVAQRSGEDWSDVGLTLSTADIQEWHELPELLSKRIGRRQTRPVKRAWKAPPSGTEELYRDYDRVFSKALPLTRSRAAPITRSLYTATPEPSSTVRRTVSAVEEEYDEFEDTSPSELPALLGASSMGPPPLSSTVMSVASSAPPASPKMARSEKRQAPMQEQAFGGAVAKSLVTSISDKVGIDVELLAYARLRMPSAKTAERGSLQLRNLMDLYAEDLPKEERDSYAVYEMVSQQVSQSSDIASMPNGYTRPWSTDYDYAYSSQSKTSVVSNGQFHSVPVLTQDTNCSPMHVVVPRESTEVFRTVDIVNPFTGPLLVGPADVYWEGAYLLTSALDFTVPKGKVSLGLGVDQDISVVRNTHYREESAGLMGGSLVLNHKIVIDISNNSRRDIDLEVRERIPVPAADEDDIKVALKSIQPPWEEWKQKSQFSEDTPLKGGYRWQLRIQSGQKQILNACYELKLPSKYELVGGNRREW